MIYCGSCSGSDRLWKSFGSGSAGSWSKSGTGFRPPFKFLLLDAALFLRKFASHFWCSFFTFFYFCFPFYVGTVSESGSGSAKGKSCGSNSCSTTLFWASCLLFLFTLDWRKGEGTADADRGPYEGAGHAEPGGPGGRGQIMQHQKGGQRLYKKTQCFCIFNHYRIFRYFLWINAITIFQNHLMLITSEQKMYREIRASF